MWIRIVSPVRTGVRGAAGAAATIASVRVVGNSRDRCIGQLEALTR